MTELTRWEPPTGGRDVVDGWVGVLVQVEELSRIIAGTDFVPTALRGRPAAVGAAILAGREIGVGPMTALAHLHVIEGRPSISSQLMRALVLAAGHRIRVVESTTTRCILAGQRSGDDEGTTVTYTMDDAKRAGLERRPNWQKNPRAMLVARATGELCRLVFADVIGGISLTVEEAGEIDDVPATPPRKRVVQRETPVAPPLRPAEEAEQRPERNRRRAKTEREDVSDAPRSDPQPETSEPGEPQSGPGGPEQPVRSDPGSEPDEIVDAEVIATEEDSSPAPEPRSRGGEPITRDQTGKLFALLTQLDASEPRERRLEIASALLSRRVASFATLTIEEASVVIDTLTHVTESDRPGEYLGWLVRSGLDHLALVEAGGDLPDAEVRTGPWTEPVDDLDPEAYPAEP